MNVKSIGTCHQRRFESISPIFVFLCCSTHRIFCLLQLKQQRPIFHKTDFHWNDLTRRSGRVTASATPSVTTQIISDDG